MLSCEELAIMQNLPALVADLESMDIIDHLTAATPPLITPTDYESIIVTSQREGRRAGVRCLIACLLRRSEIQKVFSCFLSILKEDYSHLFDMLSRTYDSLKNKRNSEHDIGELNKTSFCSNVTLETADSVAMTTPCQLVTKDVDHSKMFLKELGASDHDTLFNIISTICSHPIAVMNWKNLLNELVGCSGVNATGVSFINSNTFHVQGNSLNSKGPDDFQWCASNCRRGLFHFFTISLIRNLESRGSPFKRSYSVNPVGVKFNTQLLRKLVTERLIPALQRLDLWNLASCIQTQIDHTDENNCDSLRSAVSNRCSLLCPNDFSLKLPDFIYHNINNDNNLLHGQSDSLSSFDVLKSCTQFNYAKSLLFSCIEPIFHHSLILLDWPFLLHELNVCSSCILYLLICRSSSSEYFSSRNDSNIPSSDCNSFCQNAQDEKIKNSALIILFCTILYNTLYQKLITDYDKQTLSQCVYTLSESIQKVSGLSFLTFIFCTM
ncbi:caspase recruitment domain [Schistosoma japonicum]|uniref:Caspase recruitment domain n=1 Tax=Schistosoma japonicum TaxID=6182 RepID=A0A4Z2DE09_SCHJA|nr:caspase recruitment domain [Schistosoma japonicum]